MNKLNKEPLLHITKRKELPFKTTWAIRIGAILAALIVCAVVTMLMTGLDPFSVFGTIIYGAVGTERKTLILFKELAILLSVALALTPAFKMKFWNLGGEGQILMGAWATAICMIYMGDVIPSGLLIIICLAAAVICGAIWAMIPAFFKAKWNTNETLFTLMMNYVAIQLVAYFIILWEVPKGSGNVGIINQSTMSGWLPYIGTNSYILVILFVAVITVAMYIYLNYSKHGYEISVVGESRKTAAYVGIKVDKVIIRTLLLSGAICGFTGWMMAAGIDHTITTTLAGGRGFLGIMVSWLAQFNVIAMIFAGMLIVFLGQGAGEISTNFGLNESFADILTGIILFFIIGCEFFINYKVNVRKKSGKEEA